MSASGSYVEYFVRESPEGLGRIITASDGNLWTTMQVRNALLRVSYSGELTEFPLPQPVSEPYGITTGPDGNLWFAETFGNRIGVVLLATTPVSLYRFTAE